MPYLGKQAEEGGALISTYEFLQGTDTSTGTSSFAVTSTGGDYVRVFLNGVLLQEGASNDYTKTTAAIVITGTAPADGDLLKVDVYESITIWDTVPATGGTFTGAVTVTTGTLGSGVTGSPNLNLGNATFPAGCVLQTVFHKLASGDTGGQPSYAPASDGVFGSFSTPFKKSITPIKNNSDILIMYHLSLGNSAYDRSMYFRLYDNTNTSVIGVEGSNGLFGITSRGTANTYEHWSHSGSYLYENPTIASTPNAIEIEILPTCSNAGDSVYLNRRGAGGDAGLLTSTLTLIEIAG